LDLLDPLVQLEQLELILRFKDLLALQATLVLKALLDLLALIQLYKGLRALLVKLETLGRRVCRVFRAYRV
jgi:hypothetical protein